jgi:hypothetical protein
VLTAWAVFPKAYVSRRVKIVSKTRLEPPEKKKRIARTRRATGRLGSGLAAFTFTWKASTTSCLLSALPHAAPVEAAGDL